MRKYIRFLPIIPAFWYLVVASVSELTLERILLSSFSLGSTLTRVTELPRSLMTVLLPNLVNVFSSYSFFSQQHLIPSQNTLPQASTITFSSLVFLKFLWPLFRLLQATPSCKKSFIFLVSVTLKSVSLAQISSEFQVCLSQLDSGLKCSTSKLNMSRYKFILSLFKTSTVILS